MTLANHTINISVFCFTKCISHFVRKNWIPLSVALVELKSYEQSRGVFEQTSGCSLGKIETLKIRVFNY